VRQLAGGGGFAGAMQVSHEDHSGWLRSELESRRVVSQQVVQLVMHNFDNLLARRKCSHDLLADCFLTDVIYQFLDYFEIDVCLKQSQPDLAQGFADVLFRQLALATQVLKGTLKFFGEILKHRKATSCYLDFISRLIECWRNSPCACRPLASQNQL